MVVHTEISSIKMQFLLNKETTYKIENVTKEM